MSSTIAITDRCNQNCIYCFAKERDKPNKKNVIKQILSEKDFIILTGGETTMCPDLFEILKLSNTTNAKIELQSNGTIFSYPKFAKKIASYRIDLFNIAMPSHLEKINDEITQTKGLLKKRLGGIKNLIKLGKNVRITHVINNINYKYLLDYVKFIKKNFNQVEYLELNYIKATKHNTYLIPKYKDVKPFLLKALDFCVNNNIKVKVDHIPICYLNGFEGLHVDVRKIVFNVNKDHFDEKKYVEDCNPCKLKIICNGPRKDYTNLYGQDVLPVKKNIAEKIIKGVKNDLNKY
ncbi:MAG: radical SAM protein [Nanoarchaeota archaeon]|nr:radical SAM protein [Nanoarchaeota archaeon]